MNKKIDTNFAYAILAVITVGFLLWHSISIFNLEQDLKAVQDNTPSLRGGGCLSACGGKQSHEDSTQNVQDTTVVSASDSDAVLSNNTLDITDTHILYNEDGSIDTSNWTEYQSYHETIIHPPHWYYVGVKNMTGGSGFVSNKHYPKSSVEVSKDFPSLTYDEIQKNMPHILGDDTLTENEVRTFVSVFSHDIDPNETSGVSAIKKIFATFDQNACKISDIVSLGEKSAYAIASCYKSIHSEKYTKYLLYEQMIYQDYFQGHMRIKFPYVGMESYDEQLINEEILDIMAESFFVNFIK